VLQRNRVEREREKWLRVWKKREEKWGVGGILLTPQKEKRFFVVKGEGDSDLY
jgi:hypothetical protein